VRAYERIAPVYDLLDAAYEWSWRRRLRARLLRHARGRILEVGIGCNVPFYPAGAEVLGIDLSRRMLRRARGRAAELRRTIHLAQMTLLDLAFPDDHFDTVVATFVLLCLPAELQTPALRELHRVRRPGGAILALDYRSPAILACDSPCAASRPGCVGRSPLATTRAPSVSSSMPGCGRRIGAACCTTRRRSWC
jgi:ubiquinone/menaquinone biosynthesis C-methylase UbiE